MHRDNAERSVFTQLQSAEFGLADTDCVLQHRLEYRLQFAGRRTDDAQHLRRGRLLLQRLHAIR